MFSQISRIPDLIRKFWAKRCGLYAGVYGTLFGIFTDYVEEIFDTFMKASKDNLKDAASKLQEDPCPQEYNAG